MGTLGFQVFIEGVQRLIGKEHTHHLEDLQLVIGIMIGVIVVFFLFLYCIGVGMGVQASRKITETM